MASILAGVQIPISQAVKYARDAGFSGNSLTYIVAIAIQESSLYTHAVNTSDPYGGSFGILQINGAHFGEVLGGYTVSQATCFDPAICFKFGYAISNGGTKFTDWGTYTSGLYTKSIAQVQPYTGFGGVPVSNPVQAGDSFPAYGGKPWYDFPMYSDAQYSNGLSHYNNTDVGTPTDTPITAPLPGTITYLGYFDWGGQVSWRVDSTAITLGVPEIFVIHLDAINPNLRVGQHITAGTFLGYSGGQLSNYGLPPLPNGLQHHSTKSAYSSGPHLDIGVTDSSWASLDTNQAASNAVVRFAASQRVPYGTGVAGGGGVPVPGGSSGGTNGVIPTADTASAVVPLAFTVPVGFTMGSTVSYQQLSYNVHSYLVQNPGFLGMAQALDKAEQFPGVYNAFQWSDAFNMPGATADSVKTVLGTIIGNTLPFMVRAGFVIAGGFLLLMMLWQLSKPSFEALPQLLSLAAMA